MPIIFSPVCDLADRCRFERTEVLATLPSAFDQVRHFQIGEMFGNGLLRNRERLRELVHGRRAAGEPIDDRPPGRIGERGKSEVQSIHNLMVVYWRNRVNENI